MRKLSIIFMILVAVVSFQFSEHSNNIVNLVQDKLTVYKQTQLTEKIYLHTDKEVLLPGQELWFKGYTMSPASDMNTKSQILSVKLIDENEKEIHESHFKFQHGSVNGHIALPSSIKPGKYFILATTEEMVNGEYPHVFQKEITIKPYYSSLYIKTVLQDTTYQPGEIAKVKIITQNDENQALDSIPFTYSIFHGKKEITKNQEALTGKKGYRVLQINIPEELEENPLIIHTKTDFRGHHTETEAVIPTNNHQIQINFFPESGNLVAGMEQKTAFMSTDKFGHPVDIQGVVVNEDGAEVAEVSTFYNGRGAFYFTPVTGEKYSLQVHSPKLQNTTFQLPEIREQGAMIHVSENDTSQINLQVQASSQYLGKNMNLVVIQEGNLKWSNSFTVKENNEFRLPSEEWTMGIAKITLLDDKMLPHAERLVFVNKHKKLDISISTKQKGYHTKDKVTLEIEVRDHEGNPVQADLSLAVTDQKCKDGSFVDLASYHYLTSELKGKIKNPGQYLIDHPKADTAMDLLMLTNGWRRYNWNEILEVRKKKASTQPYLRYNLTTGGRAIKKTTVDIFKPRFEINPEILFQAIETENSKVQLNNEQFFNWTEKRTNKEGFFDIDNKEVISLLDTGKLFIRLQSAPKTQLSVSSDVPLFNEYIESKHLEHKNNKLYLTPISDLITEETDHGRELYLNFDEKNVLMEQITVTAQRRVKVPDEIKQRNIEEQKKTNQQLRRMSPPKSFIDILATVTTGYTIYQGKILLRGYNSLIRNSGALIVVDGIPQGDEYEKVNYLDPNNIESIKVYKSPSAAQKYQGGYLGGLIEITTVENRLDEINPNQPTKFVSTKGFEICKEFYSPTYTSKEEKINSVDTRRTLYWNPRVKIGENGKTEITFYNSDNQMNATCVMQGIGKQCIGTGFHSFRVY